MRSIKLILFSTLFFISALFNFLAGQEKSIPDLKFGGPLTAISFNNNGPYLSIGGGGTFVTKGNFFIGIYGQTGWGFLERETEIDNESYIMKSRQTGFWAGYSHELKNVPQIAFSFYNKFGFGKANWENSSKQLSYYDSAFVFTPNLEISYQFSKYFQLGLAVFYEIFTGVEFNEYTNKDFNSAGLSLLFKIKGTD